jgi:hypothetical protein
MCYLVRVVSGAYPVWVHTQDMNIMQSPLIAVEKSAQSAGHADAGKRSAAAAGAAVRSPSPDGNHGDNLQTTTRHVVATEVKPSPWGSMAALLWLAR